MLLIRHLRTMPPPPVGILAALALTATLFVLLVMIAGTLPQRMIVAQLAMIALVLVIPCTQRQIRRWQTEAAKNQLNKSEQTLDWLLEYLNESDAHLTRP